MGAADAYSAANWMKNKSAGGGPEVHRRRSAPTPTNAYNNRKFTSTVAYTGTDCPFFFPGMNFHF